MGDVNAQMDVKETTKVMQEFTKQNEYMNVKEDMLDDALMDAVSDGILAPIYIYIYIYRSFGEVRAVWLEL